MCLPKTSHINQFPCSWNLPPTSLEWSAFFFSLSLTLHIGKFPRSWQSNNFFYDLDNNLDNPTLWPVSTLASLLPLILTSSYPLSGVYPTLVYGSSGLTIKISILSILYETITSYFSAHIPWHSNFICPSLCQDPLICKPSPTSTPLFSVLASHPHPCPHFSLV